MFEDEVKMEEKSSNWVPMAMALGLVLALAGGIAYFIIEAKRNVSEAEAAQVAAAVLKAQGPEQIHFHVGTLKPSVDEKLTDPHYRLLDKIGVVHVGKPDKKGLLPVALTPEGKAMLAACGNTEERNADGSKGMTVTLANRKLLKVTRIDMISPGRARIEYEWNWVPTQLGDDFDVNSKYVAAMNTWDRLTLIQKYGVDYYADSKAKKDSIAVVWDQDHKTWKLAGG
jgi:hypothetical protein